MINLALAGCMDGMPIVAFFHAHNYGAWSERQNGELPVPEPEPDVEAIEIRGDLQAFNRLVEERLRAEREATEKKKGAKRMRGGELAGKDEGAKKLRVEVQARAKREVREKEPIGKGMGITRVKAAELVERKKKTKKVRVEEPIEKEKEAKKVRVTRATAKMRQDGG
ncbi:MAG: hypothetical protein M1816_000710 [Peltula sp. TS41687]|nr:MAG: hypothetical protein M1816_000710 [Peltula sp. TS41687]